jgi:hypothetical protein
MTHLDRGALCASLVVESKEVLAERRFDSPNRSDCIIIRRYYTPLDVQRMKPSNKGRSREDPDVSWRTV